MKSYIKVIFFSNPLKISRLHLSIKLLFTVSNLSPLSVKDTSTVLDLLHTIFSRMGGSPGELSEELVT